MLSGSEIQRLLREHGLAPTRALGQNFVIDANVVRKIVRDAEVGAGDVVCEVGAGLGSLTLALREAAARVVAIEIDAGLVRALREVLDGDQGVQVVHADALAVDYPRLLGADAGQALLVANLPYSVATPIVLSALRSGAFRRLLVLVQREVGQRWAAGVGDPLYSGLSVKLAALAAVRVVARVSRTTFTPVPNVDSVTVRLESRPWTGPVDRDRLFALVEAGFRQRRKRLRNALATPSRFPRLVEAALDAAGLDPGARAEELSLEAWQALAVALGERS